MTGLGRIGAYQPFTNSPRYPDDEGFGIGYFEADSRSFGTCSPTLRATIAVTRKAGFRLADWPLPGAS